MASKQEVQNSAEKPADSAPKKSSKGMPSIELKDGKAEIEVGGFTVALEMIEKPDFKGDLVIKQMRVKISHPKTKTPANTLLTVNDGSN